MKTLWSVYRAGGDGQLVFHTTVWKTQELL